jgi:hypothetical protein
MKILMMIKIDDTYMNGTKKEGLKKANGVG